MSEILKQDINMKHVVAKFIPWLLLQEQKEYRAAVANDLIQTTTNEPDFLKKVITLKGTEVSLSYVQCFSSVNVFFIPCGWILSGQTLCVCVCVCVCVC